MSKYTTGEIAKLCDVSVRTVQYYDTRGILVPSELSEGGRRLYSDDDLDKMKIICFLKDAGLSLKSISEIFSEENSKDVIETILTEERKNLSEEKDDCRKKIKTIDGIRENLKRIENVKVESLGDIANIMGNKSKLNKVRLCMLATAVPFGIMEWTSIFIWILEDVWWPFALYTLLAPPYIFWIFNYYRENVSYVCPCCHKVFKPSKKEFFFARHTMVTRRLTCTSCGHKSFCVETYGKDLKLN